MSVSSEYFVMKFWLRSMSFLVIFNLKCQSATQPRFSDWGITHSGTPLDNYVINSKLFESLLSEREK